MGFKNLSVNYKLPKGKWTSPGSDCKQFDNNEISIRWYSRSDENPEGKRSCRNARHTRTFSKQEESESLFNVNTPEHDNLHTVIGEASPAGMKSSETFLEEHKRLMDEFKRTMDDFKETISIKVEVLQSHKQHGNER